MRVRYAVVVAVVMVAFAAAGEEAPVKDAVVRFAKTPNAHVVTGFGGEWDPHFWRKPNTRRGCDEKAWKTVLSRIHAIGIARVRMMLLPDWYEPDKPRGGSGHGAHVAYTWNSEAMRSLCRQLDFCQKSGIRVNITWWCAPVKREGDKAPYWLAFPKVKNWCSAPNDPKACAENVTAALRYLIVTRGYSCIDEFTFYNEPDWAFFNNDNKIDFDYYATICRAIDARLKAAGLRDRVRLDLADDSMHKGWLKQCANKLADVADSYNAHCYVFSCQEPNYPDAMRTWVRNYVKECGAKPFSVNELGTNHCKGAYTATDVNTFDRAFCVAQFAILGLDEGMTGALFWGLYDQYYYDGKNPNDGSNGGLMKTNLMAYLTQGWRLRPTGKVWTLICHGAPRGSHVYPGTSTNPGVDGVALVPRGNGGTNVLLVNRNTAPCQVRLASLPGTPTDARITKITAFDRTGVRVLDAPAVGGQTGVTAPPESILLITFAASR